MSKHYLVSSGGTADARTSTHRESAEEHCKQPAVEKVQAAVEQAQADVEKAQAAVEKAFYSPAEKTTVAAASRRFSMRWYVLRPACWGATRE